jgi:hypothetical protein
MSYRKASPADQATLFCLAVVRARWPHQIPTLSAAAGELGVSRRQAARLRRRFLEPLVGLIEQNRPGPRRSDGEAQAAGRRMALLEALLALARGVIVSAGMAGLAPGLREAVVKAIADLRTQHGLSYEDVALQVGLCARTLRRWRSELRAGRALAPKSRTPQKPHGKVPAALEQAIVLFTALHASDSLAHLHRRFVREQSPLCATHGHPKLSYGAFRRCAGRSCNPPDPAGHRPRRGRDDPEKIPLRALALMDTSDLTCFGFPFKLIPFMEAHSRSIFAHQLCDRETAERVEQVLTEGAARTGGVLGLRVDRGAPYLAQLTVAAAGEQGIDMRVARARTATDKATLERFFLTLKGALSDVFSCLDLHAAGPGDLLWRQNLARTIASAVIAGYLRWGYPFIPQPHIDGRCPAERLGDGAPVDADTIRQILARRAQHHEHARTVAGELHEHYGFRWSMKRWLRAVRGYRAEDLREAARRFDRILLQTCFTCDPRRNPRYLLAIIRTVAEQRRAQQRSERSEQRRREKEETHRRAVLDEQHWRDRHPEQAAWRAVQFAAGVFANGGFGLRVTQTWLDRALEILAQRGEDAYRLATGRFLAAANDDERLRRWLRERIEAFRPPVTSFCADLKL